MKNALFGALIVALAASTFYFYRLADAKTDNPPNFGALAGVNRLILATYPYDDKCTHFDNKWPGKGRIRYEWAFLFGYGVDIPKGWDWQVTLADDGSYSVQLPALKQLHPLAVEFTQTNEIGKGGSANGNRWERMYNFAREVARQRMTRAANVALATNPLIVETAQGKAGEMFIELLQQALPDKTITQVNVTFAAPKSGAPTEFITDQDCKRII